MTSLLARTHRMSFTLPVDPDDAPQSFDEYGPTGPATPPDPSAVEVECNLQPLAGDVRQAAAGRQVGADWKGFFPPGTALLPDTVGTLTESLRAFLRRTTGLLLLTGPAGSGKTTTIYSCLRELAGQRHVITVEDPVEQIVDGVMQTEVNEARGLTYAQAVRHLLRQDPEVLVVGEIRDEETARHVVRAALAGHLVISTLHAGSCRGVLERLCLLCPERNSVLSAIGFILNQRLLRQVCGACRGQGCETCLTTGYHGRVPVAETYVVDESQRALLARDGIAAVTASPTLAEAGRALVEEGITQAGEVERVLGL